MARHKFDPALSFSNTIEPTGITEEQGTMSAKKANQVIDNLEDTAIALPDMTQAKAQAVIVTDILGEFGMLTVLGDRESLKLAVFNDVSFAEYLDLELFALCGHHVPLAIRRSAISAVGREYEAEIDPSTHEHGDEPEPDMPAVVTIGGAPH
jgi:hypothetical protein